MVTSTLSLSLLLLHACRSIGAAATTVKQAVMGPAPDGLALCRWLRTGCRLWAAASQARPKVVDERRHVSTAVHKMPAPAYKAWCVGCWAGQPMGLPPSASSARCSQLQGGQPGRGGRGDAATRVGTHAVTGLSLRSCWTCPLFYCLLSSIIYSLSSIIHSTQRDDPGSVLSVS